MRSNKNISIKEPCWTIPSLTNAPLEKDHYHVIVIGAGIGGLTAASLLAKRGYKVLLIESHNITGGNCTSWKRHVVQNGKKHTFTFDSGVQDISGLGNKGPLNNLLLQLDYCDELKWNRVTHAYWHEKKYIKGSKNIDEFVDNLSNAFPAEENNLKLFFKKIESVYREMYADVEKTGGVPTRPTSIEELLSWPQSHENAFEWMGKPFSKMLDTYFKDHDLKKILSTVSEYITDKPEVLLVEDMAPLYGYYFDGGFYPSGGAQKLADHLTKNFIAKSGTLLLKTKADKILIENSCVKGVKTSQNKSYFAPIVLANNDVVSALNMLDEQNQLSQHYAFNINTMNRGPSAILMSLGLSTLLPLEARTFIQQDGLAFGIGNPSCLDISLAPQGFSAVTLLCLLSEQESTNWLADKNNYVKRKNDFAERLIMALENSVAPNIRQHIIFQEVATPKTFKNFTQTCNGNIYGAARGTWRPKLKSPIEGLLLVGAGTETGAGIEAVVVSGTRAANLILDTNKKQS